MFSLQYQVPFAIRLFCEETREDILQKDITTAAQLLQKLVTKGIEFYEEKFYTLDAHSFVHPPDDYHQLRVSDNSGFYRDFTPSVLDLLAVLVPCDPYLIFTLLDDIVQRYLFYSMRRILRSLYWHYYRCILSKYAAISYQLLRSSLSFQNTFMQVEILLHEALDQLIIC